MSERKRSATRNNYICLAWVQSSLDPTAARIEGIARVTDLSSKGVGLVCAVPIERDRQISIELLVVGCLRLKAEGRVVHSTASHQEYRVGIAFLAPPTLIDAPTVDKGVQ